MASRKQTAKEKSGKKGASGKNDHNVSVVYNIANYIYPNRCHGIQIGSQNQLTLVDQAQELLHNPEKEGLSKEEVIIGMLFSILNPTCSPGPASEMSLGQLRDQFEKKYRQLKPGKPLSFKDIAGIELLSFIQNHPTWFDLSVGKKKGYYVKPVIRRRISKTDRNSESDKSSLASDLSFVRCSFEEKSDNDDYLSACSFVSDSEKEAEEDILQASSATVQSLKSVSSNEDNESSNEEKGSEIMKWKEVKRKKKRQSPVNNLPDISCINGVTNGPDMLEPIVQANTTNVSLFKRLIEKQEGLSVLFHKSDSIYEKSPCEFMLDIVSMWNTPSRSTSYIILGVGAQPTLPHVLFGIKTSRTNTFYQEQFQSDYFNFRPNFSYFEVRFHKKLFGIFEIPSSSGCGQPAITKVTQTCFQSDQLWYRPKNKRKLCPLKDLTTGLIFQWFWGSKENVSYNATPKSDMPQKGNVKMHAKRLKDADTDTRSLSSDTGSTDEESVVVVNTSEKLYKTVGNFEKSNFVLITGDLPVGMRHLEAVSLVPWVAVYDFDIQSRDKGLLSANEQFLRNKRSLHISNWSAHPPGMSENGTVWTFLRGSRDIPESRIKEEKDVRSWLKKIKQNLKSHIGQLQKFACDYTVLTVVIFWPLSENLCPFIHKFLGILDEEIEPSPKLVLCLPSEPKDNTTSKSVYNLLCTEHGQNLTVVKMELDRFCLGIKNCLQTKYTTQSVKYELPTADGTCPTITESEAAWLREDMDVLYLSSTYNKKGINVDSLREEKEQFFKGGTLPWYVWYEYGTGLDVDRDIKSKIKSKILGFEEENKSCILTLFHEPGSGGTTLAQRVLWDFHSQIPCAQIKLNTASTVGDIAEKIQFLYAKTHLPVLLLIDGEDKFRVKTLMRMLRGVPGVRIVIYVERYTGRVVDVERKFEVYLKGTVTAAEGKRLAVKFGDLCDEERRKSLNELSEDVDEGVSHCLYEFGLMTYLHEFKGVTAYVRGYLDLDNNPSATLLPWQTILGYLSLVYYYGQSSLPCQFFSSLLYLPPNYDVTIEDFAHPIDKFVVPTINEGRNKNIRICHYIIAKEILEQLLSRHNPSEDERGSELSHSAKDNLGEFFKEFIEYASHKKIRMAVQSSNTTHILTKTFIFRDNRDTGKYTVPTKRRALVSRALSDVTSEPPLFTERLQVLEKLTTCFPDDPNFHAHLGRFYALCRSNDDDEAESCFKKALDLCDQHVQGKIISEVDDRWRLSVMHIYHMYGTVLQRRIGRWTESPGKKSLKDDFMKKLEDVVEMANTACSFFQKCQEYAPPGNETIAGHIGEIMVRLIVCDFVQKKFESDKKTSQGIQKFLSAHTHDDCPCVKFVKHSASLIDSLIMECYTEAEEDDTDGSLQKAVLWYNTLFQYQSVDLEMFATGNDIFSHRLRIVAKKLKYGTKANSIAMMESITSEEDVQAIVQLYEKIFKNLDSFGFRGNKKSLEQDYMEWLSAVRHKLFKKNYSLEKVLLTVKQWNDHLNSPLSKFYLFILTSLLGFGIEKEEGCNTELLLEANIHKDELHKVSKYVLKPKYPREWLGKSKNGIRCMHPGTRLLGLGIHSDDRDVKGVNTSDLEICRGTVCYPNKKKLSGLIDLDLGDNTVPIKVFYIPDRAKLASSQYAGQRVEFILGFSLDHGYEAFGVKLLKRYGCCECRTWEEISSSEETAICSNCGNCISKLDLNTAS